MKRGIFLTVYLILIISTGYAQTSAHTTGSYKVNGTIRDAATNEPLPYSNIFIAETQQGTTTDDQGRFTLNLDKGEYTLQCSYVGYKTSANHIIIDKEIIINITLSSIDMLLQNVTVYANKQVESDQKEVSALSLQSETIEKSTSLMSDVLRSVQMLPGVTADNELSAKFNVRGGNGDENLVLINGTQVYEPYHVKEAPNASIGIFNTEMIKKMDLVTGGFSARYGDRMSSVINIEYRDGNRDHISGNASLSLTDFDALVEGPIGQNGSFILGARQSYTQFILSMIDNTSRLNVGFNDVQGVLAYAPAAQDKLSLKFIYAGDNYTNDPVQHFYGPYSRYYYGSPGQRGTLTENWNDSSESHANYYTAMVSLQNINTISSKAIFKSEFSYYDEYESEHAWNINGYKNTYTYTPTKVYAFRQNENDYLLNNNLHIKTFELNSSLDMQQASFYNTKTGVSFQKIFYNQDHVSTLTISEFNNEDKFPDTLKSTRNVNNLDNSFVTVHAWSYKFSGYHENIFQAGESLILNLGGRFDYFDLDKQLTWSPRFNFAYKVNPELTIRGAWGHYFQSPIYQQIAYSTASDTNTKSQRAIHYILGAEYNVMTTDQSFLKFKLEGYYKTYDNLISSYVTSYNDTYYTKKNDAIGRTSGLDMYIMYSTSSFSGWISYSLLKAEQKMINNNYGYFPRTTDQRHTIDLVANFDLGKDWGFTTRITYGSGFAYTPSYATQNPTTRVWTWNAGNPNAAHLPGYRCVNFRFTKDFTAFGCKASAFADISNAFNFNNIESYRYTFTNTGYPVVEEELLWPILPTLGFIVNF